MQVVPLASRRYGADVAWCTQLGMAADGCGQDSAGGIAPRRSRQRFRQL